jgi:hypothetical protein
MAQLYEPRSRERLRNAGQPVADCHPLPHPAAHLLNVTPVSIVPYMVMLPPCGLKAEGPPSAHAAQSQAVTSTATHAFIDDLSSVFNACRQF